MNEYGILESLLAYFFPFLSRAKLELVESSSSFSFEKLTSVNVHAFRMTGKTINQFFMIFSPADKSLKGFSPAELSHPEFLRQIRSNMTEPGYEIEKVEYVNGGNKNLSSPPELYKQDKLILKYQIASNAIYLVIPFLLLKDLFDLAGHAWMTEVYPENLRNNFKQSIYSIEISILYGRCHLFQNLRRLLKSSEGKHLSTLLSDLQSRNLLSYNQIASFHVFYQDEVNLAEFLPAEIKKTTLRLATSIMPLLADPVIRARWQRQLDYYFQNIFSILIMTDTEAKKYPLNTIKSEEISRLVNDKRLDMLSGLTSSERMINEIIKEGRLNDLIGKEGKELLAESSAFGEKLPLDELFKLFRPSFREDFKFKVKEKTSKIRDITESQKNREFIRIKLKLFRFLEDNIIKKYKIIGKSHVTIEYIYTMLKSLDANKMCILYNTLGFELFVSIFDSLKYLPNSPVSQNEIDSFFTERSSLLPGIEKEIAEDIYFEKINQDRMMNIESIEKHFTESGRRIAAMEQMGYLEAIHD